MRHQAQQRYTCPVQPPRTYLTFPIYALQRVSQEKMYATF
jgi:hypothetical protein